MALAIAFMCGSPLAYADESSRPVSLSKRPKHDNTPLNPKGHRTPAAWSECIVSFTDNCIETSVAMDILSYELWDEDGESMLVSCATDHELVEFMSCISGSYQLRLVTEEYLYIGYVNL